MVCRRDESRLLGEMSSFHPKRTYQTYLLAVLLGQGVVPEEHEPAADALDSAMIADALDKMRLSYRRMAEEMPTHADFVARVCAAR